jgi:hypothetical protein
MLTANPMDYCPDDTSDALPIAEAREHFESCLSNIQALSDLLTEGKMLQRDTYHAQSLIEQFTDHLSLSPYQWQWVGDLVARYATSEPIYGSFNAILVMFRLAQSHGLKRPRIRLLSSDPEPIYFELWFRPGEQQERTIQIMRGGYAGHGQRQLAGWIHQDRILPYRQSILTPGMRSTIQDLSLDPLGVSKAMASRLHACMYCGQRLTDDESKAKGYGPVCARNWELPWGSSTNKVPDTQIIDDLLSSIL